jgi:hypothetical protein
VQAQSRAASTRAPSGARDAAPDLLVSLRIIDDTALPASFSSPMVVERRADGASPGAIETAAHG